MLHIQCIILYVMELIMEKNVGATVSFFEKQVAVNVLNCYMSVNLRVKKK